MNEPQQQTGNGDGADPEDKIEKLRRVSWHELVKSVDEEPEEKKIKWLVDGLVKANGNTILAADQKFAKTLISISLALSVASGKPFLGKYKVLRPGPVYIHSPESSLGEIREMVEKIAPGMGVRPGELPIIYSEEYTYCLDNERDQMRIEQQLREERFVLQIFDPLKYCFQGSVYSDVQVKKMTQFLQRVSREYGVTNFVTLHKTKAKNADHTKEVQGEGGITAYANDIWTGSKHGRYDRKIMFEQRGRPPPQEPFCFRLSGNMEGPINFAIISEKALGSKKTPLLLRIVDMVREDREENGTDTWTVDCLREELKGSNNLYKPVTKKLVEIKFFSKKSRGLGVGENWDCSDLVLEKAVEELADGKPQSSVRRTESDGPSDGNGEKQRESSAETNTPSKNRRTGTQKPSFFEKVNPLNWGK